jgi:hypothetical protein
VSERRNFPRHPIQVPVNVSTTVRRDRAGMIRDVSASGMLFHSRSQFDIGERLVLQFRVASDPDEQLAGRPAKSATGLVVRTFCDTDIHAIFPFITAVRFEAPLLDLPL